ncbi:hypothetical protein H7F33_13195 [Pedobacter sp. PAMC26386]|nr:hypothetical protein H7F33_13195 [Pedobacter sp. PAMC26386]
MKKSIVILLLSLFLVSTTELSQLLKLPLLVEHYIQHKKQNKNLTVWQFLCIHYAHGDVRDADYDQDMKLPFKTSDHYSNSQLVAIPPLPCISLVLNLPIIRTTMFSGNILSKKPSAHLSAIWQPPKSA